MRRKLRDEENDSFGSSNEDHDNQIIRQGINEEGDNEESSKEEDEDAIDPSELSAIDSFAQT